LVSDVRAALGFGIVAAVVFVLRFVVVVPMMSGYEWNVSSKDGDDLAIVTGTGACSVAAEALDGSGLTMVFQPIFDLRAWVLGDDATVGYEALARFDGGFGPGEVFAAAQAAGFGVELETRAVRSALESLDRLPADVFLSINVSSRLVATGGLVEVLRLYDASRVVFDLIEGGELADLQFVGGIDDLTQAITDLQRLGVRIALDDTVGVDSSFSELVLIPFDILKIDRPLVRDVDKHPDRAVGITALVQLATATGADVVAEGIETADELAALINIDVRYGQGYHFAYPAPLDQQTLPVAS